MISCQQHSVKMTKYDQKFIYIDDVKIRYIDEGHGKPIVLIHGHQSRIEEFDQIMPGLIKDYRVLALDFPGSGYSDQPDNTTFSLEYYQHILISFIDKLKIDKPILVGGSLGGNLSLKITRNYPDRFSKSIAWSPAGVWPPNKIIAWSAEHFYSNSLFYWVILYFQSQKWYSEDFDKKDQMIEDNKAYISERNSKIFRRSAAEIAAQQMRDTHIGLGHKNILPTLIIVGEEDDGFDLAKHAINFSKELPNGKLIVFKNTGHSISAERPNELVDVIREFIDG